MIVSRDRKNTFLSYFLELGLNNTSLLVRRVNVHTERKFITEKLMCLYKFELKCLNLLQLLSSIYESIGLLLMWTVLIRSQVNQYWRLKCYLSRTRKWLVWCTFFQKLVLKLQHNYIFFVRNIVCFKMKLPDVFLFIINGWYGANHFGEIYMFSLICIYLRHVQFVFYSKSSPNFILCTRSSFNKYFNSCMTKNSRRVIVNTTFPK